MQGDFGRGSQNPAGGVRGGGGCEPPAESGQSPRRYWNQFSSEAYLEHLLPWLSSHIVVIQKSMLFCSYIVIGTASSWWSGAESHALIQKNWVHKNKSMQRLISSLWGTGTAKFQVTWLLRIEQKGVSMWQCCVVDRWLMSRAYRCKT